MIKYILTIILTFSAMTVTAQEDNKVSLIRNIIEIDSTVVSGVILDENNIPVIGSIIYCLKKDDAYSATDYYKKYIISGDYKELVVNATISDKNGKFEFTVPFGEYLCIIQMLGYEPFEDVIKLTTSRYNIGEVILEYNSIYLDGSERQIKKVEKKAKKMEKQRETKYLNHYLSK